ncbi:MAG: DUF2336 domain-containing protein [Pseudorhodoplanes sp.]
MSTAVQLFALANEKSSEKRLELLRRIADTFSVEDRGATPTIQYMLDEIVEKLLSQIDRQDRAAASQSLSKFDHLPDGVARSLAFDDDISVARPIIHDYRGLSNTMLVDLASNAGQPHLEAIAGRNALEPVVTDIVVQRGDGQAVRTLAANHTAKFSRFGMSTMINRAAQDEQLQELLVGRSDLSLEAIGQLLPLVSQQLAARLRSSDATFAPSVVQDQVINWVSDRKKNIVQVQRSIDRIRSGAEKLDNVLTMLVNEKRLFDVATVIAGVSDFDRDYGFNLVTQGKIDNVVVLLRALAVSWPTAESVLVLRINKLGSEMCGPMISESAYESVDVAGAQRVVRFLKVRRAAMAQEQAAVAS